MKFKYTSFVSTVFMAFVACFCATEEVHAKECPAGQYQWASGCHKCKDGCYCPGNGANQGWGALSNCKPAYGTFKLGAKEHNSGANNILVCPNDYPRSDEGASKASDCYRMDGDHYLPNKSFKCDPGKYLKKYNQSSCSPCPTGEKDYCPGGTFKISSSDQGLSKCTGSTKANNNHSGCEDPKAAFSEVKCKAGEYLPKNSKSCASCKSGTRYYCPGGTFQAPATADIGIKECGSGQKTNSNRSGCIADGANVKAGYYLPANTTTPAPCKTDKAYYCPGGDFKEKKTDQGIKECPKGTSQNKDKSACSKTVSKSDMEKCWIEANELTISKNNYQVCAVGKRYYI